MKEKSIEDNFLSRSLRSLSLNVGKFMALSKTTWLAGGLQGAGSLKTAHTRGLQGRVTTRSSVRCTCFASLGLRRGDAKNRF